MATQKIHVPALPFGSSPAYFESRSFSLAGLSRGFHLTPRLAKQPKTYYIDQGCSTVNINAGTGDYPSVPAANRSVFLGPEYIQDSGGGKHFSDFTLQDCRNAANYAYNRANGYGVVTSGAQEGRFDDDYWAQLTQYSLSAYTNLSQAWGEVMVANPGFLYFGCYDGILYFRPGEQNLATLRNALSSNANALQFMLDHTYGPNPYFQQGLYNYHPPLLNLYFRASNDLNDKYHEVRMAIQLTKMALAAVGKSWPVMVFVFGVTEFVSYRGQGYTEKYTRALPDNGHYDEWYFPQYSHVFQWDEAFTALANAEHYYKWDDTLIYGTDPAIVVEDYTRYDNFPVRHRYGGTVNQVVPMGPTPYNPASTYGYCTKYEGFNDPAPLAAEMYAYVANYGGQNAQLARHRRAGSGTWCSLDSGYLADRHAAREPIVDVARTGSQGWAKISDYGSLPTGPYDLEIDVGNGQTITVPVEPHGINLFTFSF